MMRERSSSVRVVSGLDHMSMYRRRARVSGSVRPACFSGGGIRHLDAGRTVEAQQVISPVRVFISGPSTTIRSPRSDCSAALKPA